MFNKNIHHHIDNSVRFPDTIKVNEHRAPTDESVRLLNEMEDKALDNIVLKISENRPNKFSYEVYFMNLAQLGPTSTKGILYIRFKCNNKEYTRKVNCSSDIMSLARKYSPSSNCSEIDMRLQTYILFEMSFLIAQILLDTNPKAMENLFNKSLIGDAVNFDLSSIKEKLDYDWEMNMIENQ